MPLQVDYKSKAPRYVGWQSLQPSAESLARAFARPSNLGIRTGDVQVDGTCLLAIDIDLDDAELIRAVEQAIGVKVPCKQGKKGYTWFVRVDEPLPKKGLHWYREGKKRAAGDILCVGSQSVVPPSVHPDTNQPYRWVSGRPLDEVPYREIPVFSRTLIDEIAGFCRNSKDPIYALNDMDWRGVGGGGDTHDACLAAAPLRWLPAAGVMKKSMLVSIVPSEQRAKLGENLMIGRLRRRSFRSGLTALVLSSGAAARSHEG